MAWGMIAIAAGTALAQYLNSERARELSREERARLEQLLNKIETPNFDLEQLEPEEYQMLETYTPEVAPYVAEEAPQLVQMSRDMQQGRGAQMDALSQLRQIAAQERDPAMMAALEEASRRAQTDAQSRQQSILQDAARRGIGSGAMGAASIAAQLGGAASGMERSAQEGRLAAMEAYRNRLGALRDSANLGGDIYQQDFRTQSTNADIVNRFNQRLAQRQQDYGQYRAEQLNRAQLQNMQGRQRAADANVEARNRARRDRMDMQQRMYENEMNQWRARAGQSGLKVSDIQREAQDRGQMIQSAGDIAAYGYGRQQQPDPALSLDEMDENQYKTNNRQKYGYTS